LANITSSTGSYVLSANGTTIQKNARYKVKLKLDMFGNTENVSLKLDKNGVKTAGRTHNVDTNPSGSFSMFEDTFYVDLIAGDVLKFFVLIANARNYYAAEMEIEQVTDNNVRISDSYDGRVISFTGSKAAGAQALTAGVTDITFATVKDSVGAWTGIQYRVASAGDYGCGIFCYTTAGVATVLPYINGVVLSKYLATINTGGGSGYVILENLKAGDLVSFRANASVTLASDTAQNISISKIQGPQAISSGSLLAVIARNGAGQTIPISVLTTITGWTSLLDNCGCFNAATGIFTAPFAGVFEFNVGLTIADIFGNGDRLISIVDLTNSITYVDHLTPFNVSGSGFNMKSVSAMIPCLSGTQVAIRFLQNSTGALSLSSVITRNFLSIKQVK
jgi:hypothetical protein